MSLKGGPEFIARIRAVKGAFKSEARPWGNDAIAELRRRTPVGKGSGPHTRDSYRVRNASQTRATIVGSFKAYFIDAGTVAHDEVARRAKTLRFQGKDRIVFAKRIRHPRLRARPFRQRAAEDAYKKHPLLAAVIREWNAAGKRVVTR